MSHLTSQLRRFLLKGYNTFHSYYDHMNDRATAVFLSQLDVNAESIPGEWE